MLSVVGCTISEDEHWLCRARYHFRMEEYWKNRALVAEAELKLLNEQLKIQRKRVRSLKKV